MKEYDGMAVFIVMVEYVYDRDPVGLFKLFKTNVHVNAPVQGRRMSLVRPSCSPVGAFCQLYNYLFISPSLARYIEWTIEIIVLTFVEIII